MKENHRCSNPKGFLLLVTDGSSRITKPAEPSGQDGPNAFVRACFFDHSSAADIAFASGMYGAGKINIQQTPKEGIIMKSVFRFFLLVGLVPIILGMAPMENQTLCDEKPNPIVVHVHGVRNDRGTIKAKLYGNNPEEFMVTGKKLDAPRMPAKKGLTLVCMYAPQPGLYAIVVHHDENGNRKLDRNWIGLPLEGYGFSNNPELFVGPPDHEEATFETTEGMTQIDIDMRY